jgi:hypothetical protein
MDAALLGYVSQGRPEQIGVGRIEAQPLKDRSLSASGSMLV